MATVPPPEGPTEQLRPIPAAVVGESVGMPVVETNALVRLEQVIAGLRTWLAVIGAVALAAVAVAVYALIQANDNAAGSHGGFATNARVDRISSDVKALRAAGPATATTGAGSTSGAVTSARLSARVDQLASQVRSLSAGGGGSAAGLSGRVSALESSVKSLASPPNGSNVAQSVAQLSSRVDSIASDVTQLKQQVQSQPAAP